MSPVEVVNLRLGEHVADVVVAHNLHPGEMTDADRPVVVSISNLRRADGEPLGDRPIRLDLDKAAVGAVLWHLSSVMTERPDGVWVGTGKRGDWRQEALVVGRLVEAIGAFRRLPAEFDHWLMSVWKEIHGQGPGTLKDLADAMGMEVETLSKRLWRLRSKYGEQRVPKGEPGNPYRKDEQ